MSQDERQAPPIEPTGDEASTPPGAATPGAPPTATPPADDDTVGTGSVIALGCIAGTVLLIIIGLLYLAITILL